MVTEQVSPLLLTTRAAAKRLSLAESTLRQLLASGEIESIAIVTPGKSRGSRRIPLDALDAYVQRLRTEQG
ncbi:hypothetical protein LCGC14_1803770 [marine sediment metagenome]|uniref:Helix-turn-helix domain-containing protein n=1 Tax=marine sediment metagenome TaxID=412755 RepID=A0A0F9GNQ4_9ZZZZ